MAKTTGWVVYRRADTGEFVHLSKPFPKKEQAEKVRAKLEAQQENRRISIGVGFVR